MGRRYDRLWLARPARFEPFLVGKCIRSSCDACKVLGRDHPSGAVVTGQGFGQALFTDLYELTMAQAYWAEHMDEVAVFELAFRQMPSNRNYIVVDGRSE